MTNLETTIINKIKSNGYHGEYRSNLVKWAELENNVSWSTTNRKINEMIKDRKIIQHANSKFYLLYDKKTIEYIEEFI